MIYEYDDSIHFLKNILHTKAQANSSYSLRAFAKKIGLSPGALSSILNRKKKLSVERAHEVAVSLDLNAKEVEYFMALVQMEGAKSEPLKIQYLEKIKSLNPKIKKSENLKGSLRDLEHFKLISDWYGLAMIEVISIEKPGADVKTISKRLGLSKVNVEITLERLVKLGFIKEKAGLYTRVIDNLIVESPVSNVALKNYYEGVHVQSLKSVHEQTPQEKVIGAEVFSFDPARMDEVKELTYAYLDSLSKLASECKDKTEVYQAIVNVFKLTKND